MAGNKAMRHALETKDAIRVNADVPLITDTTELITPEIAEEYLKNNNHNRPVSWKQVEEYSALMKRGDFKLTAQAIVLDTKDNLLTGQTRLWAVLLSGCQVYMRVSRGNPTETGRLLDRGRPQSARDLASRETDKTHSPNEASIARAIAAICGNMKPSKDELATIIKRYSPLMKILLRDTAGTKKTKSVLMILAVICTTSETEAIARNLVIKTAKFAEQLEIALLPHSASDCWGRGAAFGLALQHAQKCIEL